MAAANPGAQTPTRSKVVITVPPHITADSREWFISVGGRNGRRPLRTGEHVAVDCQLALEYAQHFADSREPVDAWPVGVLTREDAKRQQTQQMHLAAYNGRQVRPTCLRCGAQSEQAVDMADQPTQLQLVSALSDLEDHDWSGRQAIETKFAKLAQDAKQQQEELVRIEAEWRNQHVTCPPGTPALDEPTVPDSVPLTWRLPGVRTLG